MTAADRDEVLRKLGSITDVPRRGEDETLADWARRIAADKPDPFRNVFDGQTINEVVA